MEASRELINLQDNTLYQDFDLPSPEITTQKYSNLCHSAADFLARGMTIKATALELGIHWNSIERWLKTVHFGALVEFKRGRWEQERLAKIEQAGEKTHLWAANAWLLERVLKEKYAQPKAQIAAAGNIQINVVVGSVPGGSGTQVTIGEAPNATPCATPSEE